MLALLILASGIAITSSFRIVNAYPADPGREGAPLTFTFGQEFKIPNNYDVADSQTVFDIYPVLSNPDPSSSPSRTQYSLRATPTTVYRPVSHDLYQAARLRSLHLLESQSIEWESVEISGPDVTDQHTLGQLARMAGDAYARPGQSNWYDLDHAWNTVKSPASCHLLY